MDPTLYNSLAALPPEQAMAFDPYLWNALRCVLAAVAVALGMQFFEMADNAGKD